MVGSSSCNEIDLFCMSVSGLTEKSIGDYTGTTGIPFTICKSIVLVK